MSAPVTQVTKEIIHDFLVAHPGTPLKRIQKSLHCNIYTTDRLLEEMRREGMVIVTPNARYQNSFLFWPTEESERKPLPGIAASRTPPPFKPLGIHDMGAFMRLCESARNSDTGVV